MSRTKSPKLNGIRSLAQRMRAWFTPRQQPTFRHEPHVRLGLEFLEDRVCPSIDPSISFADQLGGTTMTIAFDGTSYWSSSGGGPDGFRYAEYASDGSPVATYAPGLDFRSVFTNQAGDVFARQYADATIYEQVSAGVFQSSGVALTDGFLDIQNAVVLSGSGTEYLAMTAGTVYRWDTGGAFLGSVDLSGYGSLSGETAYPQNRGMAVLGNSWFTYSEGVLSEWDLAGNRVETNTLNGAGATFDTHFSLSAANGLIFLVTSAGGTWNGYSVGLSVVGSSPSHDDVLAVPPTEYVIDFSGPYDPDTVDAEDLTVNAIPADSVEQSDEDTLTFRFDLSPVTAAGLQTMHMDEGAVASSDTGDPVREFSSDFRFDPTALFVTATTPADGSNVLLPFTTLTLFFSEPFDFASADLGDFILSQGSVTDLEQVDDATLRLTLDGIALEEPLTVDMPAGAITDEVGNPSATFTATYLLDIGTIAFPALAGVAPGGSLIHAGSRLGFIGVAGDTDSFTLLVDPGQKITVVVEPADTLRPTLDLFRNENAGPVPVTQVTAAGAGMDAVIQTQFTHGELSNLGPGPKTYKVRVGGAAGTAGAYTVHIYLNAAVETEEHNGAANDTRATAQSLEGSSLNLGSPESRLAVLGSINSGQFASSVIAFSSQYSDVGGGTDWSAAQALGAPDTFEYGDFPTAWAATEQNGTQEFLTLGFDTPARATGVAIRETLGNGYVTQVDLIDVDDTVHTVFTGPDTSLPGSPVDFLVSFPLTDYLVKAVTVYIDTDHDPDWEELDSVQLVTGPPDDYFSFNLSKGDTATLALTGQGGGAAHLALENAAGTLLAIGSTDAGNVDEVIGNFVAQVTGTYYAHLTGDEGAQYSLVVTRNADFDTEDNDRFESAQDVLGKQVAGQQWVLGHIASVGKLLGADDGDRNLLLIDPATGESTIVASNVGDDRGYNDLARNPVTGVLYGAQALNSWGLFSIDPASYAETFIGDLGGNVRAMAWSPDGTTLYGYRNSTLGAIDPNTAEFTEIGESFIGFVGGIAFQPGTGTLFAVQNQVAGLWTVDLATAEATFVGDPGDLYNSLEFLPDGTLLAGVSRPNIQFGGGSLVALDPATAAPTFIGAVVTYGNQNLTGLEMLPATSDFYRLNLEELKMLELQTSTPADGGGEFVNALDPHIRLYDSAGTLLAENDNGAADGRNAKLSYKVPKGGAGTYYIEVLASDATDDPTSGEYVLGVKNATYALPPFVVTDTSLPDGTLLTIPPGQITVNVNDTVLLPTLQAGDLKVDGTPAVAVAPVDGNTLTFDIPQAYEHNGHYYVLTAGEKSWAGAEAEAVARGGHLVTVNDQAEQDFLKRSYFSGPNKFIQYWIGFNDLDEEGTFVWVSGEPVDYTNWGPGQPDDTFPGQDEATINFNWDVNNGAWDDAYPTDSFVGIIELPALPAGWSLASEGLHTVTIAAGAFQDVQGTPIAAYTTHYTIDTTAPTVTASSIHEGDSLPTGDLTYTVSFSEALDALNLDSSDLELIGTLSGFHGPDTFDYDAETSTLTVTFSGLEEDIYTLKLFSGDGQFEDLLGYDLDGEAGAYPSGDGLEGGNFVVHFATDIGTIAFPTPLTPKLPSGSMIYDPSLTAVIGTAGDTDSFTINIDAGQTMTVLATASGGLRPTIQVTGPSGTFTAPVGAANVPAILQTAATTLPGVYTITIGGAAGTTGVSTVRLVLNAALEAESHAGATNDTPAGAQNIDGSFINLTTSTATRGAVLGTVGRGLYGVDRFSFTLRQYDAATGAMLGFVPMTVDDNSVTGTFGLAVDPTTQFVYALVTYSGVNSALITLDVTTGRGTEIADVGAGGQRFTDMAFDSAGTLYAITDNGGLNPNSLFTIDKGTGATTFLTALSGGAGEGLAFNPDNGLLYRFQGSTFQSIDPGNGFASTTIPVTGSNPGRAQAMTYAGTGRFLVSSFSSLYSLTTDGAMTFVASLSGASRNQGLALIGNATDHFSFTLTAGDRVTLALEALTSGNVDLALLDSDGGVLATGSTAQTNVDEMVYNFTVPYTGTYLARVTGANVVSYSLLATRNAVFDREGNNTPTSAQPMGGNAIALGHVGLSGTLILNATNSGWWNHSGFHSASNTNYLAGLEFGVTYRDFFVFDLASVTLPIAAAEIRIYNPVFASPDPTETYALFDVSTPLSALQATGSGQTGIFADLGTGVSFGTRAFSVADNGQTVSIALNAAAVASLNAGIGGAIALGGAVTTLAGSSTQYVFAFSSSGTRQLVLTLADPGDYYSFSATAGQPIHLVTATPGDGPGEFVNTLNPRLELFDPDGAPIGTVVILGDGRNEQIDLVAPAPGTYIVRVSAQGGTSGEYILDPPVAVVGALLEPTPRSQAQLGNEAATPELAAIVAPASAQSPPNSITTLVDRSSAPSPALSQLPSPIQLSGNTVWTPMSGLWVDGVAEYDELLNQVARARLEGPAASLQGEAAGPPRRDAVVAALPDGVVESGAGESSPPAVPLEEFTPSDASWAGIALVIGAWAGAERKGNAATGRRGQDRRHGRSPE